MSSKWCFTWSFLYVISHCARHFMTKYQVDQSYGAVLAWRHLAATSAKRWMPKVEVTGRLEGGSVGGNNWQLPAGWCPCVPGTSVYVLVAANMANKPFLSNNGMNWPFRKLDLHATSWFAVKSLFGPVREHFSQMFLSRPAKIWQRKSTRLQFALLSKFGHSIVLKHLPFSIKYILGRERNKNNNFVSFKSSFGQERKSTRQSFWLIWTWTCQKRKELAFLEVGIACNIWDCRQFCVRTWQKTFLTNVSFVSWIHLKWKKSFCHIQRRMW